MSVLSIMLKFSVYLYQLFSASGHWWASEIYPVGLRGSGTAKQLDYY